jgi:hypothetical protein
MSLLTAKTLLETDLAAKDARVLQCAEATHHLAAVMRNAHAWLWGLPTARLLAILNADVAVTLATFGQNTAIGLAANAALDALNLPEFPTRAPVEMGRSDIAFNGSAFVLAPPVSDQPTEQSAD